MTMKKFVVLGGGSAGWITALFLKRTFPEHDVTVIQSSEIGIIGVGEATVPNIITFLNNVGIDYKDLLKNTKGPIKNGINFKHWNGVGHQYYHSFSDKIQNVNFNVPNIFGGNCEDFYLKTLIANNLDNNEYYYCSKLSSLNKVDLENTNFAIHFDTNLFSQYLQKVGKERNIKIVEGIYKNVAQDENGFITKIYLDDGREFDTDFVFDCTGFSRLLIGKVFNEKWISYKDHLPMKKVFLFG